MEKVLIKKGDMVMVALPHESQFLEVKVENIRPFDGQTMRVKRKVKLKHAQQPYFELDGAVSEGYGLPYCFLQDWLIKL